MKHLLFFVCTFLCPLVALGQNFSYPIPPDTISDKQSRINYMVEHFWNEPSIADTINFKSPKLLLDYLYLLKQADNQQDAIQSFVSLSCQQDNTFGPILYWLDNILYFSSSPHYNEELYLQILNVVLASDAKPVMKLIPQQRVEMMSKNVVGHEANNFLFVDKNGDSHDLYGVNANLLLLIFNNPDCSLCHKTQESISNDEKLQKLMADGKLKVLAITPEADYNEWLSHPYPSTWLTGYDSKMAIFDQELYDIQRLPCIYLLDKDKRVLLKEADYNRLSIYLLEHCN